MEITVKTKCRQCQGDGWYIDHSDRHYQSGDSETCDQAGCPIQRPCENCQGTGYIMETVDSVD